MSTPTGPAGVRVGVFLARGGRIVELIQMRTKRGTPMCCNCMRAIPKGYMAWTSPERRLFHSDRCAKEWAIWAAGQIWKQP